MQQTYRSYQDIDYLSGLDKAFAAADARLRPFYKYDVTLAAFAQVMADKAHDPTDREALVAALRAQYAEVPTSDAVRDNIERLLDVQTFTVTTAHQPSLFTGPLYYVYKIVSAINLARQLKAAYPAHDFVPVFWVGSEDHDFEEINHIHLFGKTLTWSHPDPSGPAGLLATDDLQAAVAELIDILGDGDAAQALTDLVRRCYAPGQHYAQATMAFTDALFQDYGLVVVLSSSPELKRLFVPMMRDEILNRPSQPLVEAEQARKEAAGFGAQAMARAINLFYMEAGSRERIVYEAPIYKVLNRDLAFTEAEILAELEAHPERFSPNVVTRPLYQELLLPNLCYIGGGGELAYWMERMPQFAHFGLNFPMLMRRNSVLWIDQGAAKKMEKLYLTVDDLFQDTEALIKAYVHEHTQEELNLAPEKEVVERAFQRVIDRAISINPNLDKPVKGELTKILNALDKLESKLVSAEKKNFDTAINQIRSLKSKLFPRDGLGLQERHDNFIPFYIKYGHGFIDTLIQHLDPLNKDFLILTEEA